MTYPRPFQGETGSTDEERRAEADRILRMVIVEILIVCHGGNRNDTLCVVERKL